MLGQRRMNSARRLASG
jgi:hypothetical protein